MREMENFVKILQENICDWHPQKGPESPLRASLSKLSSYYLEVSVDPCCGPAFVLRLGIKQPLPLKGCRLECGTEARRWKCCSVQGDLHVQRP